MKKNRPSNFGGAFYVTKNFLTAKLIGVKAISFRLLAGELLDFYSANS